MLKEQFTLTIHFTGLIAICFSALTLFLLTGLFIDNKLMWINALVIGFTFGFTLVYFNRSPRPKQPEPKKEIYNAEELLEAFSLYHDCLLDNERYEDLREVDSIKAQLRIGVIPENVKDFNIGHIPIADDLGLFFELFVFGKK